MIGNGPPLNPFGAQVAIGIENAKVMDEIAFSVRKRFTLIASAVVDILIDPAAFTGQELVSLPIGFDAIGGPLNIDIYPGATITSGGTPLPVFNRSLAGAAPQTVIKQGPFTGLDITGIDPIELFLPSNGTGVVGTDGASSDEPLVARLDKTIKYLIRITNTDSAAAATIGLKFDFFEVPAPA